MLAHPARATWRRAARQLGCTLIPLALACSDETGSVAPGPEPNQCAAFADHTSPQLSPESATIGQWLPKFPWVSVAVHLSVLPDGRVMSFGRINGGTPQLWDPATGLFTGVPSPSLLFCGGHTLLPDGQLLVAGGHIDIRLGLPNSNLFDFHTNAWTAGPDMAWGRWYPTATMLANGEVLVIAGTDQAGERVVVPELRTTDGGWRPLTDAARPLPYYPRNFLAPNGSVFYAGEAQETSYLNTSGTGSWSFVANRINPDRDYGGAVMYEPGKVLYAGGGDPPTATAEAIDLTQSSPQWRAVGSMANPRRQLNLTILPDGRVLATGGTSAPGFSDPAGGVHAAEVWDPATERWTTWSSNAVTRVYHSTTVLLPDGRILHAGSGDSSGLPDETSGEIFEPPYLFQGPRPTITSVTCQWTYGQSISLDTPDAATIAKVGLVRLMSTTHGDDMNQRYSPLGFTRQASSLLIEAPTGRTLTPPGHYMLFIVNGSGVPSVARIIRIS